MPARFLGHPPASDRPFCLSCPREMLSLSSDVGQAWRRDADGYATGPFKRHR
jgi:hypothetical protein